jgi:TetR/AcrR family transcriptional repressor of nem operon
MCADAAGPNRGRGCLVTNSVVELGPHDVRIRKKLRSIYREFEDLFDAALKRAQAQGELAPNRETRPIARYLLHSTQGIRVLSRLSADVEYLNEIAEETFRGL